MTEIKLDYDVITTRDIMLIFEHRGWLIKWFGIYEVKCTQTNKGYHVRIETKKRIDPRDVLLVQILMGSDIHREIYNFIRMEGGELMKSWNKLYTKKLILLRTEWMEDRSEEKPCPILQEIVETAIENAKDLEGFI